MSSLQMQQWFVEEIEDTDNRSTNDGEACEVEREAKMTTVNTDTVEAADGLSRAQVRTTTTKSWLIQIEVHQHEMPFSRTCGVIRCERVRTLVSIIFTVQQGGLTLCFFHLF